MPDTNLEYTRTWLSEEDFPHLGFTRNWENPVDYPTYEYDESVVRADMQSLHDETKNYINNELIPAVVESNSTEADRAAAEQAREEAEQAREEAEQAREEAEQAREEAEQARVDETTGVVAQAAAEVTKAKSWAVGGTGTRSGEDTNNAKYWSDRAAEAVVGTIPDGSLEPVKFSPTSRSMMVRENLLHNGHFYAGALVDQRGGYVVPPGTVYAVPGTSGSTTKTDKYVKVDRISSGGYPYITIDGVEYVTNPGTEVRGYTGAGYTIDRWRSSSPTLTSTLNTNGLRLSWGGSGIFTQTPENVSRFNGKTITISALINDTDTSGSPKIRCRINGTRYEKPIRSGLITHTITCPNDITTFTFEFGADGGYAEVFAAKLELGDQQTLAHLENGNWVLNEIPNYAEELAKCQRYFVAYKGRTNVFGNGVCTGSSYVMVNIPTPVSMRANPSVTFSGVGLLGDTTHTSTASALAVSAFQNPVANASSVRVQASADGGTTGAAYMPVITADNGYLYLDANL